MAKTWATKCCPGTYKNNYQLCCGIKDLVPFLPILEVIPEILCIFATICFIVKIVATEIIHIKEKQSK
ncbi:hypothetical protein, partial [Phocaeicola dorei]|uniref:hypothetical protein n=1 Tax=Phocaeicola dorei TaxID=357276 RepID=UPI001E5A3809